MYITNMKSLKNKMAHFILLCASFLLLSPAQASDQSLTPKQFITELIDSMEVYYAEKI